MAAWLIDFLVFKPSLLALSDKSWPGDDARK